ncbi:uncharacterized protein LOC107493776 [Arachis duranensis]|uniref:Uncharacterized protein LOC107493776 n=1 Tax=Arachis duranensis TaxID=130453 RepID=A0A6P4DLJ2_ARADU|nr:uncharacterized protein LOC107493776 [Arachis duranensis]
MKEILESQHEDKEMGYVLQQVEEDKIVNEEEVIEDLGEVEQEVDFKLENTSTPSDVVEDFMEAVEPSSNGLEFDVEEDNAQPPRHNMSDERLEEYTSVEHPQANGQAEAANKVILAGLKRRLQDANGAWAEELPQVLWAYQTTPHSTTKESPFRLVYGMEAMILVEIEEGSPRVVH